MLMPVLVKGNDYCQILQRVIYRKQQKLPQLLCNQRNFTLAMSSKCQLLVDKLVKAFVLMPHKEDFLTQESLQFDQNLF